MVRLYLIKLEPTDFGGSKTTVKFSVIVEGVREKGESERQALIRTAAELLGVDPAPYLALDEHTGQQAVLGAMFSDVAQAAK